MDRPDFGEIQLQSNFNQALTFESFARGQMLVPVIPTLAREQFVFYDTGFFLAHLPYERLEDQRGCNVFFQYKISERVVGPRARHRHFWNESFFQFEFFHRKRERGRRVISYAQFDGLRRLAQRRCGVFYVTNNVLDHETLERDTISGDILRRYPLLDVRQITGRHDHATFTVDSPNFVLHSKPTSVDRVTVEKVFHVAQEKNSLGEDNDSLFDFLTESLEPDSLRHLPLLSFFVDRYLALDSEKPRWYRAKKFFLLQGVLQTLFGVDLVRLI